VSYGRLSSAKAATAACEHAAPTGRSRTGSLMPYATWYRIAARSEMAHAPRVW
jgi:hypothetical protein